MLIIENKMGLHFDVKPRFFYLNFHLLLLSQKLFVLSPCSMPHALRSLASKRPLIPAPEASRSVRKFDINS